MTVPPSHHSTSLPLSGRRLRGDVTATMLELFWHFCHPPLPPPVALKSQLCVRDLQTHGFFVLVFSSFHCDTKKLRSLIKK